MLTVISPAKALDFESPSATAKNSRPGFTKKTNELIGVMRGKTPEDLSGLMGISPKLAELNVERFRNFKMRSGANQVRKQAILAFKGDVYRGLDVDTYSEGDFTFAQQNLRILSGLYGLLKPLDMIQPYRLEMGTRLKTRQGNSLYEYWGDDIGKSLAGELGGHANKTLINLASNEYFKAVRTGTLPGRLITPVFKEYHKGSYRVIGLLAKKARGSMASFIVKHRIGRPDDIKDFREDGYRFNKASSTENQWVFTRKAD